MQTNPPNSPDPQNPQTTPAELRRTSADPVTPPTTPPITPPITRPAWMRVLDALAMTLLVIAGVHEAVIWLGGEGWLARLPSAGGSDNAVVVGIVFALAAAYGVYLVVRSWRRVG
ncbi:hypothetical protein EM868_17885 [Cupriavidus gilardii]|uniref:hypothetical protein n=1 Tax=Cupriavidus gilardii TaxID=82541 RepID=UPI001573A105|nr:hypothetical protein [Cupriavidus gilardii]MCG5262678.1 hypothetical protein [Cupriavidus gilardii]MDF9431649.1 hypothetical protein [Cupriavidus gilardii]NSX02667.1 hypothetical protein [Cupriavidus gilardii]